MGGPPRSAAPPSGPAVAKRAPPQRQTPFATLALSREQAPAPQAPCLPSTLSTISVIVAGTGTGTARSPEHTGPLGV